MKEDLSFKQDEMSKSEATASGLAGGEHDILLFHSSRARAPSNWTPCYGT